MVCFVMSVNGGVQAPERLWHQVDDAVESRKTGVFRWAT